MTLGTSLKVLQSLIRSDIVEISGQGGTLTLRRVNERIMDLFKLTHTNTILKIEP